MLIFYKSSKLIVELFRHTVFLLQSQYSSFCKSTSNRFFIRYFRHQSCRQQWISERSLYCLNERVNSCGLHQIELNNSRIFEEWLKRKNQISFWKISQSRNRQKNHSSCKHPTRFGLANMRCFVLIYDFSTIVSIFFTISCLYIGRQ